MAIIPHLIIGGTVESLKNSYRPKPIKVKIPAEKITKPKMFNGFILPLYLFSFQKANGKKID